ncbi:MAG: hypothetical protein PW734_01850 [Verrucomicrobium sp.]|nr:hypothetical protein [Verrucomicrobium sp.]
MRGLRFVPHGLAATALTALVVGGGLLLALVPGVFWLPRFGLAFFASVDRGLAPVAALKRSAALTQGERRRFLALLLALVALNSLGIACFFVGTLVTTPLSLATLLLAYDALDRRRK